MLIVVIPCPVSTTLFILDLIPFVVISLFTNENISSILASIISINSELFIILFFVVSLHVFSIMSLSLSINDFKAKPYCLF